MGRYSGGGGRGIVWLCFWQGINIVSLGVLLPHGVYVCVTWPPAQLVLPIRDLSRSGGGVLQLRLGACYKVI